ncbi:T9SS type A sorting domain-containing protein [Oceanihabitans sp. 2_MG-2023]|uniref:T9SS type A sorting domain-containing protein n=1 Tax=Oceanihabitans sp. 2_MG-2023 TaxID=3062661 RepID=UPI0026E400F7|nr:T9SS type A sorting domain-containing protein [Oceanihabitans sp. 2_MG-2023]MDO6595490.1 T9SS type A sorting domain-containing protein [Oceanihabitans sp. 2_MG-2023]
MKKIYLLFLFTIISTVSFAQILSETFDTYTDGTGIQGIDASGTIMNVGDYPAGVSNWTIDGSQGAFTAATDWAKVSNGQFEFRDVDGEVALNFTTIDITNLANVYFTIDVLGQGNFETADYVDVYYAIDGGAFTRIPNWNNLGDPIHTIIGEISPGVEFTSTTINQNIGTGSSLTIKVTAMNNAGTEYLRLDNVNIYGETLSVDQNEVAAFSIYPNPVANGIVTIKTSNNEAVQVSVFDVLGKQVLSQNVTNQTLDVSNLNAGMYILKLVQNGNSTTKKLVIN